MVYQEVEIVVDELETASKAEEEDGEDTWDGVTGADWYQ